MATVPVPRTRAEHYKAFLALPTKNLPDTFDRWRDERAAEEIHYTRKGWIIEPIEIEPEEFSRFCRTNNVPADGHAIKAMIEEKSRRQGNEKAKLATSGTDQRPNKIVE